MNVIPLHVNNTSLGTQKHEDKTVQKWYVSYSTSTHTRAQFCNGNDP